MKLLFQKIMLIFSILYSLSSWAKTITIEIPDDIFSSETTYSANFDGSINIINPQLFFNGSFLPISGYVNLLDQDSFDTQKGLCTLLGRDYRDYKSVIVEKATDVLHLRQDGSFNRISYYQPSLNSDRIIKMITCR